MIYRNVVIMLFVHFNHRSMCVLVCNNKKKPHGQCWRTVILAFKVIAKWELDATERHEVLNFWTHRYPDHKFRLQNIVV
jgi:hypothetical protein